MAARHVPSPATPDLLKILAEYHVPATFFQVGENISTLPDTARAVPAAGHEIGNHSHSHSNFAFHSPQFIQDEFARAQDTMTMTTGCTPTLLRAPYGVRWFGFREMQRRIFPIGIVILKNIAAEILLVPISAVSSSVVIRSPN